MTKAAHMGGSGDVPAPSKAKPSKKSILQTDERRTRNARARRYAQAAASLLDGHDAYALDLASRAAISADLLLNHYDPDVRLTAIGRALRASLTLIDVHDAVVMRKRIEAIEKRLGIEPGGGLPGTSEPQQ